MLFLKYSLASFGKICKLRKKIPNLSLIYNIKITKDEFLIMKHLRISTYLIICCFNAPKGRRLFKLNKIAKAWYTKLHKICTKLKYMFQIMRVLLNFRNRSIIQCSERFIPWSANNDFLASLLQLRRLDSIFFRISKRLGEIEKIWFKGGERGGTSSKGGDVF